MKRTFNVTLAIEVECDKDAEVNGNFDFMVASQEKNVQVTNFFEVDSFEVYGHDDEDDDEGDSEDGEDAFVIDLGDGTEVKLVEKWEITDVDSYPIVEVIDCETNEVIGSYFRTLPDIEDDDFDMDKLIKEVRDNLY